MTYGDPTACATCYHSMLAHWPTGSCKVSDGMEDCHCERYIRDDGGNSDDWPEAKARSTTTAGT